MIKKTITYTDYDGNNRTEDFYFNLSKAELFELQTSTAGGLDTKLKKVISSQSVPEIISLFKEMILMSYGIKSDDGKRFIKSAELRDEFSQTEAYSNLFIELASDSNAAAEFVNGIVPADLKDKIDMESVTNEAKSITG